MPKSINGPRRSAGDGSRNWRAGNGVSHAPKRLWRNLLVSACQTASSRLTTHRRVTGCLCDPGLSHRPTELASADFRHWYSTPPPLRFGTGVEAVARKRLWEVGGVLALLGLTAILLGSVTQAHSGARRSGSGAHRATPPIAQSSPSGASTASYRRSEPPLQPTSILASDPLGNALEKVQAWALNDAPSIFGGIVLTNRMTRIDVYLTTRNQAVERQLEALAPPASLSFLLTPYSWNTLNGLVNRISAAMPAIEARGIAVKLAYTDVYSGKDVIAVENLTRAESQTLSGMFGTRMVTLVDLSASQVPVPIGAFGINDSAPWNGGASIYRPSNGHGTLS